MKIRNLYLKMTIVSLMVLVLSTGLLAGFTDNKKAEVPNMAITLSGVQIQNNTLKYPVVLIDGDFYLPLSWELVQMLGYTSHYTNETGLSLKKRTSQTLPQITALSTGQIKITKLALPVNYPVSLENQPLVSKKPLYNLSGVTYVPLNDTPALSINTTYSNEQGLKFLQNKNEVDLPTHFNTYDQLDIDKLIRNQGTASTCWAFAANTLFEVAIAKHTGVYKDFSEDHLITNTPIPATYQSGGNFLMSSIYYQNKLGPVNETLAPIESQSKGKKLTVEYTLLSYEEINNDLSATKEAIYENGSVLTSLYLNEQDKNVYNSKNFAYYNDDIKLGRTHELVLVGWDDAYSKDNFTLKPKSDGAFIAQNSFGNSWGDDGFFYISYEDVHILTQVYHITDFERTKSNAFQYLYDQTGITHFESFNENNIGVGVNNYKALSNETLKRISVYTPENNMNVALYYGNGKFSNLLGTPNYRIQLSKKGYHSIDLPIPLALKPNASFWIAARYEGTTPFLVPIEAPYPGIGYTMSSNPGEGFIGDGITFSDIIDIRTRASIGLRATTFK